MSLSNYVVALLLSVVIEISVAYIMGFKKRKYFYAVAAINFVTNPVLNYFILLMSNIMPINFFQIALLEIGVILIEWKLLLHMFDKPKDKFLLYSAVSNVISFIVGLLIFNAAF